MIVRSPWCDYIYFRSPSGYSINFMLALESPQTMWLPWRSYSCSIGSISMSQISLDEQSKYMWCGPQSSSRQLKISYAACLARNIKNLIASTNPKNPLFQLSFVLQLFIPNIISNIDFSFIFDGFKQGSLPWPYPTIMLLSQLWHCLNVHRSSDGESEHVICWL